MSVVVQAEHSGPGPEAIRFEDTELQRVQEFNDTIARVTQIRLNDTTLDFNNSHPTDNAVKLFRTYHELDQPIFYLSETLAPHLSISGDHLSFDPLVSRGGKSTHHGVFFGDLQIGPDQTIPVAVKPHALNSVESCLRDYLNNDVIRKLGFHTPESVGYIVGKDGKTAYSMSRLDETLTTLEGIDWSNFFPDVTKDPGMQEMWHMVSQQVALIHSKGNMSHGDLAPRNIATSTEGGIFIIDWEKAHLSTQPPKDSHASLLRSHSDLSILLESMCRPPHVEFKTGIGIFYGKTEDWWKGFCDIFYDEYCEVRLMEAHVGARPRQGGMQRLQEVEEELEGLTRLLKEDVEMYQAACAEL